jgi:hypothetical protein
VAEVWVEAHMGTDTGKDKDMDMDMRTPLGTWESRSYVDLQFPGKKEWRKTYINYIPSQK